jgi:hypothetical protein
MMGDMSGTISNSFSALKASVTRDQQKHGA